MQIYDTTLIVPEKKYLQCNFYIKSIYAEALEVKIKMGKNDIL